MEWPWFCKSCGNFSFRLSDGKCKNCIKIEELFSTPPFVTPIVSSPWATTTTIGPPHHIKRHKDTSLNTSYNDDSDDSSEIIQHNITSNNTSSISDISDNSCSGGDSGGGGADGSF